MPVAGNPLPPYINGRFVALQKPERLFEAANPARPAQRLAVMGWQKEVIPELVEGMRNAQRAFELLEFSDRMALVGKLVDALRQNAEEIKSNMMLELARSRVAVEEEWQLCERLFTMLPRFCEEALSVKDDHQGWSWIYAPVGLVLVSSNVALPLYSVLSTALPALAAGNAVCIRPSLHGPLSASQLASCVHQSAFPPGLVQLVYGDIEVYRRLILTHQFDTVLYTGGEETLEQIRRDLSTHQNSRLVLCSGGKNAALVTPSSDLDATVRHILYGATVDCGQRLEATGLVFVHESVAQALSDKIVAAVKALPIGVKTDLASPDTHVMGPLCSNTSWERYLRFQGIAARESDETLRWGKSIDNPGNGFFVSPGVHLVSASKFSRSVYAGNAFFGPDVAIVPVSDSSHAVSLLDDLGAARVLAVHTAYPEEVHHIRKVSQVPTVAWNRPTTDLEPNLPTIGRHRAGNSYVTGARFLFSTVFPKTLNLRNDGEKPVSRTLVNLLLLAATTVSGLLGTFEAQAADYRKAVEGNEVVKGKLYPKAGRFQLNALQGGGILNQSFINTTLISLGATYHFNEWHAVSVDGILGISQDRDERKCVETFFFDEKRARDNGAGKPCDPEGAFDPSTPNPGPGDKPETDREREDYKKRGPYHRKPAYMNIRQIDQIIGVNYQWTPVYGKSLWFLSGVGYLDFYTTVGLGIALNTYSPMQDTVVTANGTTAETRIAGTADINKTGVQGRPPAEKQTSPTLTLGLGNRFFFAKHFLANVELRHFTVFGGDGKGGTDAMMFFALWGGLGIIF